MGDLISRSALYKKVSEMEELARKRVLDTPTSSPCYIRYMAQLNELTYFKYIIADQPVAFDVDNVIYNLDEASDYYECDEQ